MRRLILPLNYFIMLRLGLMVLAVTCLYFVLVLGRLQHYAETEGTRQFEGLSARTSDDLSGLFDIYARYLQTGSALVDHLDFQQRGMVSHALANTLISELKLTFVMLARPNDDFLVVQRNDPAAPAGATFLSTWITGAEHGPRRREIDYYAPGSTEAFSRQVGESDYRPTEREWFQQAMHNPAKVHVSPPRRFVNRAEHGVTLSKALPHADGVLAISFYVSEIEQVLARLHLSANAAAVVFAPGGELLARRLNGSKWQLAEHSDLHPARLQDAGNVILAEAVEKSVAGQVTSVVLNGATYFTSVRSLGAKPDFNTNYQVLLLAPTSDFTGAVDQARGDAWVTAGIGLLLVFPLAWFGSRSFSRTFGQLMKESARIKQLDFTPPHQPIVSNVREVHTLAHAQQVMRESLADSAHALGKAQGQLELLIEVGMHLVSAPDRAALLAKILRHAKEATGCACVLIFVRAPEGGLSLAASDGLAGLPGATQVASNQADTPAQTLAEHTVSTGRTTLVDDLAQNARPELQNYHAWAQSEGLNAQTLLAVPLRRLDGRVIGVIQLVNATEPDTGHVIAFSPQMVAFVLALAGQGAVALDNHQLIESQRQVMDSLVRLLAGAVDAKSAHTGGHCERVPQLAVMLAEAAEQCTQGSLARFKFNSEEERHEFRIGTYLHDCGKVTTPDHVIDKATKLETVHNRIHEIRARFEILLRDARIGALQSMLAGSLSAEEANALVDMQTARLRDDFAFVARCNIGGEHMADEDVQRLRAIGAQRWWRYFDDRLGLSFTEQSLHQQEPEVPLPAEELLLADKPWQRIPRAPGERERLAEGFQMDVPEWRYDNGELHNLCVARGTLSPEERFKINEHIIQTIRMLENTPFPENLRRVPEYAGTHHETLDGNGYPRRLAASQLSIPARIVAVADIFEALTAADRPYKRAKTLTEALDILHIAVRKGKLDADVFALLLQSGVYLRYAQKFLLPEQLDGVEISRYLG